MSSTTQPGTGSGSHAAGPDGAGRRRRWLLPLIIGAALVLLLLLLLSQCTGGDSATGASSASSSAASSSASSSAAAPSTPTPTPTAPESASAAATSAGAGNAAVGGGTLTTAGGAAVLPLAVAGADGTDGGLASVSGQQVTATAVTVQSVPADEGFWVGTSESDRVWVQLSGTGESTFSVEPGQTVSFTATVVPNAADFASTTGVDEAEGAAQLTAQGQHLDADRASLVRAG